MQPRKSPVGVGFWINRDVNLRRSELLYHCIEMPNTKVDHPLLISPTEVICVVWKGREYGRAAFLRPGFLRIIAWRKSDPQVIPIPLA